MVSTDMAGHLANSVLQYNMTSIEEFVLLLIEKLWKSRYFQCLTILPTAYEYNRKVWVMSEIFGSWLKKMDKQMHT